MLREGDWTELLIARCARPWRKAAENVAAVTAAVRCHAAVAVSAGSAASAAALLCTGMLLRCCCCCCVANLLILLPLVAETSDAEDDQSGESSLCRQLL